MSPARHHPLLARLVYLRRLVLRTLHLHCRGLIWGLALLLLLWGGVAASLQWWFFPRLEQYRPALVAEFSRRLGQPVEVDAIVGGWRAGKPYLDLRGISVRDPGGALALSLPRAELTLSWWPLLLAQLRFERIAALAPQLNLSRDRDGIIWLGSLALNRGPSDNRVSDWLLRQHEIAIVNGSLRWRDARRNAPLLALDAVNLELANLLFGQHRLQLSAIPPASLARPLDLDLQWRGDDVDELASWRGTAQLRLAELDLAAAKPWLDYPLALASGRLQIIGKLGFHGAHLDTLDASVQLQQLQATLAGSLAPLRLRQLQGHARWNGQGDSHSLRLDGLKLALADGRQLDGAEATLTLGAKGGQLEAGGLVLDGLGSLPDNLPLPAEWRARLGGWQPHGRIDRLAASWQGRWQAPTRYALKLGFSGLGVQGEAPRPSLGQLDGELNLDQDAGQLALQSSGFNLDAGEYFLAPLAFKRLRLAADWQRQDAGWSVQLRDLLLANADLDASANGRWDWPGSGLGRLRLDADIGRLRAGAVADYLPTVLGRETLEWLKQSLSAGEARQGHIRLDGPLADFPFAQGGGVWQVDTEARGVTLAYAPGWPAVEAIDGHFGIVGNRMEIRGQGRVLGTRVSKAQALIADLAHSETVDIDGKVDGPSAEFFRFIAQSPLERSLRGLGSQALAAGNGELSLQLAIPLADAEATRVKGSYAFRDNQLRIGQYMPQLSGFGGVVHFTEKGVSAQGLSGRGLGGALRSDISTSADGTVEISGSGRADLREVGAFYQLPQAERLSGSTSFRSLLRVGDSGVQLQVDAPLNEARIDLPAPLGKPLGESRPLRLQLEAGSSDERWRLGLGSQLNAEVQRSLQGGRWQLTRGEVRLGNGMPNVANRGLWLTVNLPEIELDPWLALQQHLATQAGSGKAASDAVPELAGLEMRVGSLRLLGKQVDELSLRAVPQADAGWQLTASARQVEGKLSWSPQARGRIFARLSRLQLPLPEAPGAAAAGSRSDERPSLPAIDLVADDLQFRKQSLGKLVLQAQRQRDSWQIDALNLNNPDGQLNVTGSWRDQGADSVSRVRFEIESANVGKLLGRFGYPEMVQRGSGKLSGDLSWQGVPTAPDYPSLSGNLTLRAENGQFAKIDPGVGRLLGILSLQSLPRRLSLDFRDVFSEGFAFDRIEGDSKIVRGLMTTDNLVIVGPAAQVLFRGEADVARETQKLRVRIVPVVGDSVAVGVGVALVNPIAAVGAFLLQRALKDPLGRLIAYEYDITGKWSDPQVKRAGSNPGK